MKNSAEKFNSFSEKELEVIYLALISALEFCDEDENDIDYVTSKELAADISDILENIKNME